MGERLSVFARTFKGIMLEEEVQWVMYTIVLLLYCATTFRLVFAPTYPCHFPSLVVFLAGKTPYRGHRQRTPHRWELQRVAALHPERCVAALELVLLDETSLFEVYHRLDGRWQHQGEAQPFSAVRPTAGPQYRGEEERSLANKDSGRLQSVTDPRGTWKGGFW